MGECRQPSAAVPRPRLGKKIASEVTKHDIAPLSNDIVAGKHGVLRSATPVTCASAASGLFKWAAQAGRDYVTASPCVNLPKLDEEHPRTRVLTEDEIRILWHGLDRPDMPWDRKTCLAIKFALVTMLRRWNCSAPSATNCSTSTATSRLTCPEAGQEAPRDPAAAVRSGGRDHPGGDGRTSTSALRRPARRPADEPEGDGDRAARHQAQGRKVKTPGICALLGLNPSRRTICGARQRPWRDLGFDDAWIAKCLDHADQEEGRPCPASPASTTTTPSG